MFLPGALTSCTDGVKDGNEEGVDCGGPNCPVCPHPSKSNIAMLIGIGMGVMGGALIIAAYVSYRFVQLHSRVAVHPVPGRKKKVVKAAPRHTRGSLVVVSKKKSGVLPDATPAAVVVDWESHEAVKSMQYIKQGDPFDLN